MTPVFMRRARSHTWTLEAHSCTHDSWHDDGIHVTSHAWHHDTLWRIKLDSTTELLPTRFLVGGLTSIMAKAVELITQVTFLTQNQKVMPGENFRAVVDAQSRNLLGALKNERLSFEESTKFCEILENGPWNATQKTLLGEAAASAVSVNTDNKPAKRENQQLNNWFAFLTAKDKEFFKSDATLNRKVSHAVDICGRLDLYWPSEQTCGHVLSTIKNLVGNNALIHPQEFHAKLNMFKQMLRARTKKVGKNATYLQQYPDQPTSLPATVRQRFMDAEGGELDPGSVTAGGPLRGSHKTLKTELQLVPAVQQPAALQSANTMMELLRSCSLMMQQQQQQQQQSCMLPGFRWLTSNPQASGATAPASSTASIALNSPSAGQALQDTPSVAGAKVPGGTKEDESQEVAAENDAVAHGQDPVNPAEQAAAMLQSWGIPVREDEHGNILGGGRGRGGRGRAGRAGRARGRGRGLKKPAAASPMKALLKKPASSTSTVKCTRAAMPKLTKAERVRYRPHGCHKCRFSPGCSPSCYPA